MKLYVNKSGTFFTIFPLQQGTGAFEFEVPDEYVNHLQLGLNDIDYPETTSETLVFTKDPETIVTVDTIYKDTETGEIIYTQPDNNTGNLQEVPDGGVPYIQASHMADQTFPSADTPQDVLFDTIHEQNGITLTSNKIFKVPANGKYKVCFSAQPDAPGGTNKEVQVWFTINAAGVPCSNVYTHVNFNAGSPLPKTMIIDLTNEDEFIVRSQVSNSAAFLNFEPDSGDIPCTPSVMISMYKID